MKKSIIQTILGMATLISLFLVGAESETFIGQVVWSGSWLAATAVFGKLFGKTLEEKV